MAFTESKVTVVGRLGADPELRSAGGKSVLDLRVCANVYRGKGKEETPVWYRASVWENYADALAKSGMSKGDLVYLSGDLVLEEYTTKDGEVKTALTILQARVIPMSNGGGQRQERAPQESRGGRAAGSPFGGRVGDFETPPEDDIPY